jgi:hypothetical protein
MGSSSCDAGGRQFSTTKGFYTLHFADDDSSVPIGPLTIYRIAIVFVLVLLSWLIIENVVEFGVLGYVCSEFGDTFAAVRVDRHINTMAKSSSKLS